MANRFPIIVDSSGVPALKELASGDNLDLTGSGIVNAGTVAVNNLIVGGNQGTNGQTLQSTGSGVAWADAAGGRGAWNVMSSTTVSSSVTSVTLSNLTGYSLYRVTWNGVNHPSSVKQFILQCSTDNGSSVYTTDTFVNTMEKRDSSTSGASYQTTTGGNGKLPIAQYMALNSSDDVHYGEIDLINLNASGYTYAEYKSFHEHNNGGKLGVTHGYSLMRQNVAFNAIRFTSKAQNGSDLNINGGTFVVYGLSTS